MTEILGAVRQKYRAGPMCPRGFRGGQIPLLEGIRRASFKQKQELELGKTSEAEGLGWRGRVLQAEGTERACSTIA